MRNCLTILCVAMAALVVVACKKSPPPDDGKAHIAPRTDYAPEEFGIGRHHTPDRNCNRDIDRLLDEVRLCYKSQGVSASCDKLQQRNSERITRLKNTVRCAR